MQPGHRLRMVALVGCGKQKLDSPAPARKLYTSTLFRLSATYAEGAFDAWYVVSARHGLIHPDETIEPYDESLADFRVAEREAWADRVAAQLARQEYGAHFTILAGGHYTHLAARLRLALSSAALSIAGTVAGVETPLDGLPIGHRLAWLKRQVQA